METRKKQALKAYGWPIPADNLVLNQQHHQTRRRRGRFGYTAIRKAASTYELLWLRRFRKYHLSGKT